MAYEEVSNSNFDNDREFKSAKIGTEFEGTFVSASKRIGGQYGEYRVLNLDLRNGEKIAIRASKILLEKLEAARPNAGDGLKIVVESAQSKGGRTYALPRVYVDRRGGAGPVPPAAEKPAPAAVEDDDNPPF